MRSPICAVVFCAMLAIASARPATAAPAMAANSSSDLSELAFRPHPGAQLPLSAQMLDENARTVRLSEYFTTSPVIVVLEYLRCTSLCGVTLHNLIDALARLPLVAGRDYQLVAISIDPRDSPVEAAQARANYAASLDREGTPSGLHFLTAPAAGVQEIANAIGFSYRYDSLLDAYIHPAGFIVASPTGAISHYVEGVAASPQTLIDALADAQQDKSQGLLTRLLLLCHVQDAPLGRFTVPVLSAYTIADITAAFALIALFAVIRRRRHQ